MIGKIFSKEYKAFFLGLLIFLTPLANSYVLGSIIQQPRVSIAIFTETIDAEGRRLELMGFGKLTEYSNGTKVVEVSVTIENICPIIPKIRINFTKTVTPEELSLMKGEIKINEKQPTQLEKNPQGSSGPYDGYNFTKRPWDNITFVFDSPQIWIKYPHDDNYQTYYPGMFNYPWHLPPHAVYNGKQYYNEKFHIHMAIKDVYDWKVGARSRDEIMRLYLGLGGAAAGSFLGAFLGGALVLFLSLTGWKAVIVEALAAMFGALIGWFLQLLGVSEAQWVENVVEAEQGDGFWWSWGFHTKARSVWIYECYGPQFLAPKTEVWVHEIREFYATWGKDRDSSPGTYTGEIWYHYYWNA
ncbi:MAG: hypothetical protein QXL77_08475, partial [Candidatus Bathyarchaeia archaeon]